MVSDGALKELVFSPGVGGLVQLADKGLSLDRRACGVELDVGVLDRGGGTGDNT